MKNILKWFGIIVFITIIGFFFIVCDNDEDNGGNSGGNNGEETFNPALGEENIGKAGPGGGIIFYYLENGFAVPGYTGEKGLFDSYIAYYLEATTVDLLAEGSTSVDGGHGWSSTEFGTTDISGLGTGIGAGRRNTALILAIDANAPAAKICAEYSNNNKSDWFLPNMNELDELRKQKTLFSNLPPSIYNNTYISSEQYSSSESSLMNFNSGYRTFTSKSGGSGLVRAVRAF
jgi:hypothetical protein